MAEAGSQHGAACCFLSCTMAVFARGPGTTILPGRPAAIWSGVGSSVQQVLVEDLLLSVEYDEFLPYGLQALLEVSILPKSREANVNDGVPSRGA